MTATKSHKQQCYWCDTCDSFRTNKATHKCPGLKPEDPDKKKREKVACPVCNKRVDRYALLPHIRNVHKDVDPDMYRSKAKPGSTPEEKKANRESFLDKVREVIVNSTNVGFFLYESVRQYEIDIQLPSQ